MHPWPCCCLLLTCRGAESSLLTLLTPNSTCSNSLCHSACLGIVNLLQQQQQLPYE